MRSRGYVLLALGGLAIALLAAVLQAVPGYMDAEYYYAGALRLAGGQGATEPYLWNYLNHPQSIPAPSFAYWMPLVSLLGAAGLKLLPGLPDAFWSARFFLILLAAMIPPLTAALSYRLTGLAGLSWLAGVFALFPGFYLAYITTTDAFAIYMAAGGLLFWLAARPISNRPAVRGAQLVGLGLLAGVMHLARADGLVWLLAVLGLVLWSAWAAQPQSVMNRGRVLALLGQLGLVLAGYALVVGPWYARNLLAWGSLFPPGNGRTLWLAAYEQTMIYPPILLTPQGWLNSGWAAIMQARWDALSANLQSTVAVQGGIALLPFMLTGLWKLRDCTAVRLAAVMWLMTFAVMTVIFPFAGINGAFFHSGAAFQPLWWAAAPLGIETVVLWLARLRRWQRGGQVLRFLSVLLVVVGVLLSAGIYLQRVVGSAEGSWNWSRSYQHYREVEQRLLELGAQPGQAVLVNNPPGYYLASGRQSLVIPYGDERMLLQAAGDYGVDYLVLEDHNPPMLQALYNLRAPTPDFEYLGSVGSTRLFRIVQRGP